MPALSPAPHDLRSFLKQHAQARSDMFAVAPQELEAVASPERTLTFAGTLAPYSGPWTAEQAAHLIRRTCFGIKKEELDQSVAIGMAASVAYLMQPLPTPPPPVNDYDNPDYIDPVVVTGETWVTSPYNGDAEGYRIQSWRGWWIEQMLQQGANLRERMTLFWHHHFATQTDLVFWGRAVYEHNAKLRAGALGNFRDLVKTVTTDNMMLVYLNGYLNTKGAPDENYARELQELFTIGKDNPNHYTEADVVAAARVLTGWKINFEEATSYHSPIDHDFENKQFSAFYNNTVIEGSVFGEQELDALLNMIFAKDEVAEYLCRKLYRWFVYYHIDDTTEENIIQPLAAIFRTNNYNIQPVLETLLQSEHFYEAAQTGCFIKTPADIVVGNFRTFNTQFPGTTLWDTYILKYYLSYFMMEMRMLPGDPPNVAGWQAFRQTPQYYRLWINGDTLRVRNQYTDAMTAYFLGSDNDTISFDLLGTVAQLSDPSDPNIVVQEMVQMLLPVPLSPAKQYLLKSILLSGLPNDSYWTNAWNEYVTDPADPMAVEVVQSRLVNFHLYLTRLPEFQLS